MWKIQDLFFPTHTLCEKLSTFYITIVISLLLQATGNKARNRRRWTEDTWLLFGSQVFSVKRRAHFPFRAVNSVSPIHTMTRGLAVLNSGAVPGSPDLPGLFMTFLVTVTIAFPGTPSSQSVRTLLESRPEKKQLHVSKLGRCPNTHDLGGEDAGRKTLQGNTGSKHTEVLKHTACPGNSKCPTAGT